MEMFRERANPNSHPAQGLPSLWMRRHARARAGALPLWEQVKAAGAESLGRAPHSPCCPPSPSPGCGEALREDWEGAVGGAELPGPRAEQWDLDKEEEEEWKYCLEQEPSQWALGSVHKLYPQKYERHQEPSRWEDERYHNLLQWEGENYEKLYRWEYERHQELSQVGGVRYRDFSQWEDESVQKLYQWEHETHQQPSHWGNESPQWGSESLQRLYQRKHETVQQLYQWEDDKYQELSQKEFEIYQELSQWEIKRRQDLSHWETKRDEELSQEQDDRDKVLCQWEGSMVQELFEGEFRADPEFFHEGDDSDKELSQEDWEHIPNHTTLVNPMCPQLLHNHHSGTQGSAKAAASPALWEQMKASGESPGPAPHSPCCPLSPLPHWLEALRGEWTAAPWRAALPMPQTQQQALSEEENEWKCSLDQELSQWGNESVQELSLWKEEQLSQADPEDDSDKVLCQWEDSTDQELSWCEVRGNPELSQGEVSEDIELSEEGDNRNQELLQENYEYITIYNIWVNPKYPELLQNSHPAPQESAQAAASPFSREWLPEAGTESRVPRKRPSRCRRVLRALRRLFRIPCMVGRPED